MTIRKLRGRPPACAKLFKRLIPLIPSEIVSAYNTTRHKLHLLPPHGPVFPVTIHSRLTYTIHNEREVYAVDRLIELSDIPGVPDAVHVCGRRATLLTDNVQLADEALAYPDVLQALNSLVHVLQ